MARVLGLDPGSYSLKAVLVETTLRGSVVKKFYEVPTPTEGARLEGFKAALAGLLAEGPLAADSVVTALPGVANATHHLSLPFTDQKKIEATLPFELEGQLPFDMSEAVFDYQLGVSDERGAQLLVGVVRRDELSGFLEVLKNSKLDPRVVTLAGLASGALLPSLPEELAPASGEDGVALVDIGHERTTVAIGRAGEPVELTRSISGGGLALSKALAAEFNISLADAQSWKEAHGAVASAAIGPDAERAAAAFVRALQPVLRELRPTFKTWSSRSRRSVGRIVLCGGTARLRGLAEQFERDLGVSTRVLSSVGDATGTVGGPQCALAWALALRGQATGAKAPRFNLRRGEFAFKSDFDFMREKVGQLVAFAAVLLVLLVATGMVRNAVLERREKQVDAMLCNVTNRILGKCEKDYDRALNLLRGQESPAAGVPTRSATSLLAELVQRIPPELPVTMDQIVVDLDRINVRCEIATMKQVEELVAALKTYHCFKEVQEGKIDKSKDGTKVTVRLDIQVECPNDVSQQG